LAYNDLEDPTSQQENGVYIKVLHAQSVISLTLNIITYTVIKMPQLLAGDSLSLGLSDSEETIICNFFEYYY